jgi:hypothetical protein
VAIVLAAEDPSMGTWKLNLGKSKFVSGPPPRSRIMKIEAQGSVGILIIDGIDADGKSTHSEVPIDFNPDGKEHPISGSTGLTRAAIRLDSRAILAVWKKDGKQFLSERHAVSGDGKTTTVTKK